MTIGDLLEDAFGRIRGVVRRTADGLTVEQLAFRPDEEANSIGWLLWHLTRIAEGWADRFGLPFPPGDTGYGHRPEQVAAVQVPADLLISYHEAVYRNTAQYVDRLTAADLERVVDEAWDPPVTLGVRLVSVISDDLQHAGQAAYLRGLVTRR